MGLDLLDVERMAKELERGGADYCASLFTPSEIAYCQSQAYPAEHFAARFAAKEATLKALGSSPQSGFFWKEIEVERGPSGHPTISLHGRIRVIAEEMGVARFHVTLTHTRTLAAASVVVES